MNVHIQNIGIIEDADISVNGLTVIGGYNDTGKSTVGRLLFTIIKALNTYKLNFNSSVYKKYEFIFAFNKKIDNSVLNEFLNNGLLNDQKYSEILEHIQSTNLLIQELLNQDSNSNIEDSNSVPKITEDNRGLFFHLMKMQRRLFSEIKTLECLLKQDELNSKIDLLLDDYFVREFNQSISNFTTDKQGRIDIKNLISISEDSTKFKTDLENIETIQYFLDDCIFIDTPFLFEINAAYDTYLQQKNLGIIQSIQENNKYTLHHIDLLSRLKGNVPKLHFDNKNENIGAKLNNIISGKITYNDARQDFSYRKDLNNGEILEFTTRNTASGIKVLGILEHLIEAEQIDDDTILVFDEPENHLHPQWQIQLAEIMVDLVNAGVRIMVSSHSPYMIQALRKFSNEKIDEPDKTNFYLTTKNENNLVNFVNVNDSFSDLFLLLNEPFREIL